MSKGTGWVGACSCTWVSTYCRHRWCEGVQLRRFKGQVAVRKDRDAPRNQRQGHLNILRRLSVWCCPSSKWSQNVGKTGLNVPLDVFSLIPTHRILVKDERVGGSLPVEGTAPGTVLYLEWCWKEGINEGYHWQVAVIGSLHTHYTVRSIAPMSFLNASRRKSLVWDRLAMS